MYIIRVVSYCVLAFLCRTITASPAPPPSVKTANGTYIGVKLETFSQEAFYGIPYATPPLGDLRLRRPLPFNQSWTGVRNATVRSFSCPGYNGLPDSLVSGSLIDGLILGEDCLTIDIVRPANTKSDDGLPVFVWIYGGGQWRLKRICSL